MFPQMHLLSQLNIHMPPYIFPHICALIKCIHLCDDSSEDHIIIVTNKNVLLKEGILHIGNFQATKTGLSPLLVSFMCLQVKFTC